MAEVNRGGAAAIFAERHERLSETRYRRGEVRAVANGWGPFSVFPSDMQRLFDQFFRRTFGYGYLPMRGLAWTILIVALSAFLFEAVWKNGEMAPVAAPVMVSDDWKKAVKIGCPLATEDGYVQAKASGCVMPVHIWTGVADGFDPMPSNKDHESFDALLYGADVFIPLVGFGQEVAWAPSRDRGPWGKAGFHVRWFVQFLGWIITALGAAVLTGLVGRRD